MRFVGTHEHHLAIVRSNGAPCDGGDVGVLSNGSVQAADRSPAFRLLRHHTKNALQRIVSLCEMSALRETPSGAALAEDILRRILLSAEISEALFGLTAPPAGFERRFASLIRATIALLSDDAQIIDARVETVGHCPEPLVPIVLQVAHELVGNAVRHGMLMRATGTIVVSLRVSPARHVRLTVSDDGCGPGSADQGEGGSIIEQLIAPHRGVATLKRRRGRTVAEITIPPEGE